MKDDLISRKAALDAICENCIMYDICHKDDSQRCEDFVKVRDVPLAIDLSGYSDKLWRGAFETGKKFAAVQSDKCSTPCDLCKYDPPSSGDGKPCSMCPATAK